MTVLLINNVDKSDYITELSSFRYTINKDFTFELPNLNFESAIDVGNVNDTVKISNSTGSAEFYITEKKQDFETLFWNYKCEHLLYKLKAIKTNAIPYPSMVENVGADFVTSYSSWSDLNLLFNNPLSVTECYRRYNNFDVLSTTDGAITQAEQQYYQVLFLMQILIRKATGKSVNDIDISSIENSSSIFHATQAITSSPYWQHVTLKNREVGIPIQNLKRLGTDNTYQFQTQPSANIEEWDKITDCLELLSYLCSSMMLVVDIFGNYTIKTISQRTITNYQTTNKDIDELIRLRKVSVSENVLSPATSAYGSELYMEYYQADDHTYHFYTFGDSGTNDRELEDYSAGNINNLYYTSESVAVSYPSHFKLYQIIINTSSYYRSRLYNLRSTSSMPATYPPDDRVMYWANCIADALFDYWESFNRVSEVTEISEDIELAGHETEINIEDHEIEFVRYDNV